MTYFQRSILLLSLTLLTACNPTDYAAIANDSVGDALAYVEPIENPYLSIAPGHHKQLNSSSLKVNNHVEAYQPISKRKSNNK